MMPKFGMLTTPTKNILDEIKLVHDLGFDFVEIFIEGPENTPEAILRKKDDILRLLKKYKMFALVHTSSWVELGSQYEPVRRGWIEECKKVIQVSSQLKIPLINFNSSAKGMYMKDKKGRKLVLNNWIKSLNELVEYGKKLNVEIMLENIPASDKGGISAFSDFKYIFQRTPGLKLHLDLGHAFIKHGMKSVEWFVNFFPR